MKRGNLRAKFLCLRLALQPEGAAFLPPQCLPSRLGAEIEEIPHGVAIYEGSCTSVGSIEVPGLDAE